eukprot:RCo028027
MAGAADADVAVLAPARTPAVADKPVIPVTRARADAHQLNRMIDDRVDLVAAIEDPILVEIPVRGIHGDRDRPNLHKGLQQRLHFVGGQADHSRYFRHDFGESGIEVASLVRFEVGDVGVGPLAGDATASLDPLEGHPLGAPTAARPRAIVAAVPGVVGAVQDLLHRELSEGALLDRPNALQGLNRRERPAAPAAALVLHRADHPSAPPVPLLAIREGVLLPICNRGITIMAIIMMIPNPVLLRPSQRGGGSGRRVGVASHAHFPGGGTAAHQGAVVVVQRGELLGESVRELVDALLPAHRWVCIVAADLVQSKRQQRTTGGFLTSTVLPPELLNVVLRGVALQLVPPRSSISTSHSKLQPHHHCNRHQGQREQATWRCCVSHCWTHKTKRRKND